MGNLDFESPLKKLQQLDITPPRAIGEFISWRGERQPVMYDYPLLSELKDTRAFAHKILNSEMRQYLHDKGYVLYEGSEPEYNLQLLAFRRLITNQLENQIYIDVDIGMPIMVERIDSSPIRSVNIIFALVRDRQSEFQLLAHPIVLNEQGSYSLAVQHRSDNGEFDPPFIPIQKEHVCGYRGMFASIISYPVPQDNGV